MVRDRVDCHDNWNDFCLTKNAFLLVNNTFWVFFNHYLGDFINPMWVFIPRNFGLIGNKGRSNILNSFIFLLKNNISICTLTMSDYSFVCCRIENCVRRKSQGSHKLLNYDSLGEGKRVGTQILIEGFFDAVINSIKDEQLCKIRIDSLIICSSNRSCCVPFMRAIVARMRVPFLKR